MPTSSRHPRLGRLLAAGLTALSCAALPAAAHAGQAAPIGQNGPALETVGDVNGDGLLDYAGWGPRGDGGYAFQVALGTPGPGAAQWPRLGGSGFTIVDASPGAGFGWYIHTALRLGDFDRDGLDDLLLSGSNSSFVVYGARAADDLRLADGGPRHTRLTHAGVFSAAVSPSSRGIGDFDGDGYADLLTSRPGDSSIRPGSVGEIHILRGRGDRPATVEALTGDVGYTRLTGDRQCKVTYTYGIFPAYFCAVLVNAMPIPVGDVDGDGKDDLYQPVNRLLIRGRPGDVSIPGNRTGGLSTTLASQPTSTPWDAPTPDAEPDPEPEPGTSGTDGWTLSGSASRNTSGGVVLTRGTQSNVAGGVFDARRTVDARNVTVEFDLQTVKVYGSGFGIGVAFASRGVGGVPAAKNAGIGHGWVGNKGTAVLLGTVKAGPAPSGNWVGIASDVVGRSGYPTLLQSAAAGSTLGGATNRIKVVSAGGVVSVQINGVERLRRAMVLPADAYVGLTASTSSNQRSDHVISNVRVTTG